MYAKKSKCTFFVDKVVYLGFIVSKDGISPDPNKVEAIVSWPIPHIVFKVCRFLGLVGWCRVFVREYTFITKPLTQLTRKDEDFSWSKVRNQAFNKVKKILASEPILKLLDFEKTFEVIVDTCG